MAAEYTTQRLDHLGIVAGICQEIGLAEPIDRIVGLTERQVSVGEAVHAMVLNALGFTARPLSLTPEFFANKPLDRLLRPRLTAEMLNDDSLGRALDILHEKGETEVFAQVASHALRGTALSTALFTWTPPPSAWKGNTTGRKSQASSASPMAIPATTGPT